MVKVFGNPHAANNSPIQTGRFKIYRMGANGGNGTIRHEIVNNSVSELWLLLLLIVENACKAARLISRLALLQLLLQLLLRRRRRLLLHTITNECEHGCGCGCGCGCCCRECVRSTRLTSRLVLKL